MIGIYRHYKNQKTYLVLDNVKVQKVGVWVDAVAYCQCDLHGALGSERFVREMSEFREKFTFVQQDFSTRTYEMNDGTSFLEQLRSFQLSDILGKFKIF